MHSLKGCAWHGRPSAIPHASRCPLTTFSTPALDARARRAHYPGPGSAGKDRACDSLTNHLLHAHACIRIEPEPIRASASWLDTRECWDGRLHTSGTLESETRWTPTAGLDACEGVPRRCRRGRWCRWRWCRWRRRGRRLGSCECASRRPRDCVRAFACDLSGVTTHPFWCTKRDDVPCHCEYEANTLGAATRARIAFSLHQSSTVWIAVNRDKIVVTRNVHACRCWRCRSWRRRSWRRRSWRRRRN